MSCVYCIVCITSSYILLHHFHLFPVIAWTLDSLSSILQFKFLYYFFIFSVKTLNKQIKLDSTLPFHERNKPAYGFKVGPKKWKNYRNKQEFFGCKYCSCDYKRKQQLLAHILRRHIKNNIWLFVRNAWFLYINHIKIKNILGNFSIWIIIDHLNLQKVFCILQEVKQCSAYNFLNQDNKSNIKRVKLGNF